MIYAVNKRTKEHRVVKPGSTWREYEWELIQADADGWIEWSGGECPLPENEDCEYLVHINHGNRDLSSTTKACYLKWSIRGHSDSVIAYRPVLEPQAEQVKEWRGSEDGLPPVGIECEFKEGQEGREGEITHHLKNGRAAIIEYKNGGWDCGVKTSFRPIRTDRERWLEAATRLDDVGYDAAVAIYDAGLARLPD